MQGASSAETILSFISKNEGVSDLSFRKRIRMVSGSC